MEKSKFQGSQVVNNVRAAPLGGYLFVALWFTAWDMPR